MSFLRENSEAVENLKSLLNRIQVEMGHLIVRIISDKGGEFDNVDVNLFCESKGIEHEFSVLKILQHNGLIERKNKVLQEMTRVMIHMHNMQFWTKTINTACYTTTKFFLRLGTKKTSYELREILILNFFRTFSNGDHILRDEENLGKFDVNMI